jgi:hypothetical protein
VESPEPEVRVGEVVAEIGPLYSLPQTGVHDSRRPTLLRKTLSPPV